MGSNYQQPIRKQDFETLINESSIREALSILSEAIPDASGCVTGAMCAVNMCCGIPVEGPAQVADRDHPPLSGTLSKGTVNLCQSSTICSILPSLQSLDEERMQTIIESLLCANCSTSGRRVGAVVHSSLRQLASFASFERSLHRLCAMWVAAHLFWQEMRFLALIRGMMRGLMLANCSLDLWACQRLSRI